MADVLHPVMQCGDKELERFILLEPTPSPACDSANILGISALSFPITKNPENLILYKTANIALLLLILEK